MSRVRAESVAFTRGPTGKFFGTQATPHRDTTSPYRFSASQPCSSLPTFSQLALTALLIFQTMAKNAYVYAVVQSKVQSVFIDPDPVTQRKAYCRLLLERLLLSVSAD